jgi:hypothetical protein
MHIYSMHLCIDFHECSISKSCISPLVNWKSIQFLDTFSIHFLLSSQLFGCLPFRPEHYTKNIILWCSLVLAKRLQSKYYLKVGSSLDIMWYIAFPYPYLSITNHVMVSYMTSFSGIHSYNRFIPFIALVITS